MTLRMPMLINSIAFFVLPGQLMRGDTLVSLMEFCATPYGCPRLTKPESGCLYVHIVIGNLKAFLLEAYHGESSKYLQEYLNKLCYRFYRRAWEAGLPLRLFNACLTHTQVKH